MVASPPGRRPASRPRAKAKSGASAAKRRPGSAAAGPAAEHDEIGERAARLGITPERVLREYARIAFADLKEIIDWGPNGIIVKESGGLTEGVTAAISEITARGAERRVKLYDKKAALDAIARHLGMFARGSAPAGEGAQTDLAEDAREVLARRLARLAAGGVAPPSTGRADGKAGGGTDS